MRRSLGRSHDSPDDTEASEGQDKVSKGQNLIKIALKIDLPVFFGATKATEALQATPTSSTTKTTKSIGLVMGLA